MSRSNRSLALSCLKRYTYPMTAWQIGKSIGRNPASVSSELCRMAARGEVIKIQDEMRNLYVLRTNMKTVLPGVYT